jgi:hypothetical protein
LFIGRFEEAISMYSVYVHTFPNKKVYVGITSRPVKERWGYGNNYTKCVSVYRAIKKYGWNNIRHDVIRVVESKEEAERLERLFIYKYGSNDPRFGYNLTAGGDARGGLQQESKDRIGDKNKAIWASDPLKREEAAKRMKKRMENQEYRDMVLMALGNAPKKGGPKRVLQIDNNGNIIKVWDSSADIQNSGIATRQAISLCCLGKIKTCKGFVWKFAD